MRCQYSDTLTRHLIFDAPREGKFLVGLEQSEGRGCPNEAEWRCGTTNQWHLCSDHAIKPIFKRLRMRVRLETEDSEEEEAA